MATDKPGSARRDWHRLECAAVAEHFGSHLEHGLSAEVAAARLAEHGANELLEARRRSPWRMLAEQFTDVMILVLIAAAVIAGFVGEPQDSLAIVVIVVLNGLIGFVQEARAERAMAALQQLASPRARVVRDGRATSIDARELAPGDLVEIEAGVILPADLRLTELAALRVDESTLTGESQPADKHVAPIPEPDLPLGDRLNLAFKGTVVTHGRARGLVVATGMSTELGRIAGLLSGDAGKTPLQKRLAHFGRQLAVAVLAICALIFVAGWLRGEPPLLMLLTAISLAVAAIPEALPAVVTISLALGAARMVRQQALIRRLPAVETLGSVTVICTDKTGTLTQNRMQVDRIVVADEVRDGLPPVTEGAWRELARAMALCSDAQRNQTRRSDAQRNQTRRSDAQRNLTRRSDAQRNQTRRSDAQRNQARRNDAQRGSEPGDAESLDAWLGDPTETALVAALDAAGIAVEALRDATPRLAELPFDATRARMSTFHPDATGCLQLTKGAPERLLPLCGARLAADGTRVPLDREAVHAEAERLAGQGLRVLAFARKPWPALPDAIDIALEDDLVFIGLVGLIDPPRPEAAEAVAACRAAGIVPVMITGDHPATARTIAERLGLVGPGERVLTGRQLAHLADDAFSGEAATVRVYARIDPEQKLRIVKTLQERGEFVAMTGDGVNDAPALKQADIGVAMGRGGTDVAREAAAMTLLDDNFATIVKAVAEGRRIFDNIRKFVKYTMTSNSGELWTLFLAPFLGLPIPLLPIHILWINLVTDGLPGLALAVEPAERDVMRRPPRPPRESLFARGLWQHVIWAGLLMAGVTLLTQAWAIHSGTSHWQTMVFTVLTLSQLGHALAVRSEHDALWHLGLLSNRPLAAALLLTLALQLAVIYLPWCNAIFHTQPLSIGELLACLALSSVVFVAVEIEKALLRRGWLRYR